MAAQSISLSELYVPTQASTTWPLESSIHVTARIGLVAKK